MADTFPASFEVLFAVPSSVKDEDLQIAVKELAETIKSDLVITGAPTEVIMSAAACVAQFAKHMQASRNPYGLDQGGYLDPGSERMALSSIHTGLKELREALAKIRSVKATPEQVQAAVDDRDMRFQRAAHGLFKWCRQQQEPLAGDDLMFQVQAALFDQLKQEGLAE